MYLFTDDAECVSEPFWTVSHSSQAGSPPMGTEEGHSSANRGQWLVTWTNTYSLFLFRIYTSAGILWVWFKDCQHNRDKRVTQINSRSERAQNSNRKTARNTNAHRKKPEEKYICLAFSTFAPISRSSSSNQWKILWLGRVYAPALLAEQNSPQ